jgi:trimeric autotransporter adhesin
MQETLAHDWSRRMAGRSILVAMLLAVPVLMGVVIGFSSGVGGLSFGIGSLASGPENSAATGGGPGAASGLPGLGAVAGAVAAPLAATGPGTGGGDGGGPAAVTGPGLPPTVISVPPGIGPTPGGTRQVGQTTAGGGSAGGGGSSSPLPGPEALPSPSQAVTDPVGTADAVVGTAQDTVTGLLDPHR